LFVAAAWWLGSAKTPTRLKDVPGGARMGFFHSCSFCCCHPRTPDAVSMVRKKKIMESQVPTIGVVGGTGAEGSAIALRLAHAGYRVIIGTRDSAKGARVTAELNELLGADTIAFLGNAEAARTADIVILTVPFAAQKPMVQEMTSALEGKILIDATAPLVPPKVSNVQLPPGGSAVAEIQRMLGGKVRVVSAFQNVAAHKLRKLDADVACDVLVCGDDPDARSAACELIGRMGLRAFEAGPICNSAAAEALTSLLIFLNRKYKVSGAGIRITGLDEGEDKSVLPSPNSAR
jgi:8-hydroxy-5-deazaflavin:NADPH oxidoreductase